MYFRSGYLVFLFLILIVFLLTGCVGEPESSITPTESLSFVAKPSETELATLSSSPLPTHTTTPTYTVTATQTPTFTRTQTPTITPTPPELPIFTTSALRPGVLPQSYEPVACMYLSRRWAEDASPPGTVVVPVMFHSIVMSGRVVNDPKDISEEQFQAFVQYANYLGFRTITTSQLMAFLVNNDPIPPRSMIMILDDRRPGVVRDHFLPVLKANDWTLTLAYIADPETMGWAMEEVQRLAVESGRLDVQSHGYSGQLYIVEETALERIQSEIWDSTPVLEEVFGQRPSAFIWPGGNFSAVGVQVARQGGYELAFTAFSRGPLMYNWVPQGEPEQSVGDPLMLLPRAWSNSVNVNLNEAVSIAQESVEFARANYAFEADYYRTFCASELPALDSILPESIP